MTTNTGEGLILDSLMPDYDVALAEHLVVSAGPATTWRSARELDLLTVHSTLLDAAMWIRGLPARLVGRSVPVPPRLVIANGGLPALVEVDSDPDIASWGRPGTRSPSGQSAGSGARSSRGAT